MEGDKIRVKFKHTAGGLKTSDGERSKGFAIAGEDHKFVWAEAKIDGDSIVLWSKDVAKPVAVRYAWADSPSAISSTRSISQRHRLELMTGRE